MRHITAWLVLGLMGIGFGGSSAEATKVPRPDAATWVIESANYTGEVIDQIARLEARYIIRIFEDGWTEVPLSLDGATITAIEITKKTGETHLAPRGQSYVLVATKIGTYKVHLKYSVMLAQDSQFEGLRLGIPQATFSTVSLFVPRKDVELRPQDQLYVERRPDAPRGGVTLTARLGASDQVDLRWRTKPATPVKIDPVLYGEVNTLVSLEEQLARLTSIVDYRMAQGETKELAIQLPSALNVLNVRGAGIEDWHVGEAQDPKMLMVTLSFFLKDTTYRLVIESEQTITDGSTEYLLPSIQLTGVKQERGYLAVSRAGNIELSAQTTEGINRVDVKELPDLLRAVTGTAPVLAFKYHQHPYRVTLAMTRHQDHAVLAAIAERAELATILSRQGELLTRATYLIKANKKQYVGVVLPDGAILWSCIVSGKSVKPVEGKNHELLVPLDTMTEAAEAVPVELVYFERRPELIRIGHLNLKGPVLDVPTTIANWAVYAPHEIKFLRVSGNLERGLTPFEFLEEPFVQTVYAQAGTEGFVSNEPRGDKGDGLFRLNQRKEVAKTAVSELSDYSQAEDGAFEIKSRSRTGQRAVGEAVAPSAAPVTPSRGKDEEFESVMGGFAGRLKETGILPLKIQLPKSGSVYRFSRLMTTQDALTLDATFVHLHLPWVPFAALGLLLVPMGSVALSRFHRG